ncbi:hypothetical protein OF829_04660 [Sphingomonas sp. LB-2]|uniref:hypothetical protein n=1 Tax=Sphingomonas caeni TaxID=2984949 RepID=UPI0022300EEF|nr:hypothetical protein [Sphingomonas caeni]MCW3846519.1 hypothetical protein [Sphingomonas caeni]
MIIEHEDNPSWSVPATRKPAPGPVDEVETLLKRYPLLSTEETRRCVAFLAEAPIAERGRLSARPGMAAKMDQLRRDHPKPFKPSIASYLMFGTLIAAILVSGFLVAG